MSSTVITMPYREYKQITAYHFNTIKSSYNRDTKTIDVIVPDLFIRLADIIPADVIGHIYADETNRYNAVCTLYYSCLPGADSEDFNPDEFFASDAPDWFRDFVTIIRAHQLHWDERGIKYNLITN